MADALDQACRDESDVVRVMAAEALSRQGDPRALGYLMALLDEQDAVAIEAMGSIRDLAEKSGLPDDEGQMIVARNEDEGTKSRLQPHLAFVTGLARQKAAASERPPSEIRPSSLKPVG